MAEKTNTRVQLKIFFILFAITVHSFFMNGYYAAHRQLTVGTYISQIKALVDPSLYKNSIYVQAVNRCNLRIGFFYDLAPFILKYVDLETFAIIQAFSSIFFTIAGIFMLGKVLFRSSSVGFIASLLYTTEINNWTLGSPAPYLNFFQHGLPYAYPLIVWSIVFFYQKRYPVAFLFAGIAFSFHSMCASFLLVSYFIYWIFNVKEFNLRTILLCISAFTLPSFSFLIRSFSHVSTSSASGTLWLKGIEWVMWFTCLPSTWLPLWLFKAGLFFMLSTLCFMRIKDNKVKQWFFPFLLSVALMCLIGTVYADFYPVSFIIKLSLWRSTIIYLYLALPCIAYVLLKLINQSMPYKFLAISLIVLLTGYMPELSVFYFPFFLVAIAYALYEKHIANIFPALAGRFPVLFFIPLLIITLYHQLFYKHEAKIIIIFLMVLFFLFTIQKLPQRLLRRPLVWSALFILLFDTGVLLYKHGPDIYFHGTFKGKIDPWADIQLAAKNLSYKDDLFIVPPHMNDFTTYSERAVLGDWAEGSTLVYLDNQFTQEWFERMFDLGWKEAHLGRDGYNALTTEEIIKAGRKYRAKFVVTEKPKIFNLRKVYENEKYLLYLLDAHESIN